MNSLCKLGLFGKYLVKANSICLSLSVDLKSMSTNIYFGEYRQSKKHKPIFLFAIPTIIFFQKFSKKEILPVDFLLRPWQKLSFSLFLWLLSICIFASLIFLHLPLKPVPLRGGGGGWEGKRRLQTSKFQSQHLHDDKSLAFFIYHYGTTYLIVHYFSVNDRYLVCASSVMRFVVACRSKIYMLEAT